jgi:hypothetical protein
VSRAANTAMTAAANTLSFASITNHQAAKRATWERSFAVSEHKEI